MQLFTYQILQIYKISFDTLYAKEKYRINEIPKLSNSIVLDV